MDIKVRKLNESDLRLFIDLIRVFEEVFEMKNFNIPSDTYLQKLLGKKDFFVFVALQDDKVVGGLTSYLMDQYYSTSPLAYIYDLAIKYEYQRKGIGKLLLKANNSYCQSIGVETVMVEAEEVDEYAVDFYRKTGAKGLHVIHFDYFLKD